MAEEALVVADRVAKALAASGAEAVALVGSHARGEATARSDVDLAVVGEGPRYRLEAHEGVLVSIGWASEVEQRRRLYEPEWLCTHVPGWRTALPLHDPVGIAASIVAEACAWTWPAVEDACDRWAAEAVTGLAEEAQKLLAALRAGDRGGAAAQRSLLALGLARPLALRRRELYASENRLWSELGGDHAAAFGLADRAASRAALALYADAVDELRPCLDDRQRAVVEVVYGVARSTISVS